MTIFNIENRDIKNKILDFLRKNYDFFLFLLFFLLIFTRFVSQGFEYYKQLDDYIQLHNYATSENYLRFLNEQGLLSARPLAGIFDLYIWSQMYDFLILAVGIISMMYAASAIFFKRVLERYFRITPVFLVIYTLVPAATEGAYWLSASTRIIVGLFFVSLSMVLLQRFLDGGKIYDAVFFAIFQLISYAFYEQVLVLSFAFSIMMFIMNYKNNRIRAFITTICIPNAVLFYALCLLAGVSKLYGSRMELALPFNFYYYQSFLPEILRQIKQVFLDGNIIIFLKGFIRGITSGWWAAIAVLAVLSALLFFFFNKRDTTERGENKLSPARRQALFGMLCGFILAVLPVSIFLFIANPWFSFRCMIPALPGIALFFDSLFALIFEKAGKKVIFAGRTALSLFAFICCVAVISEVGDYKQTYLDDKRFTDSLAEACTEFEPETRVGILNVRPSYLTNQNYYYHEHIHGVTESSWALSGMMTAKDDNFSLKVVPMTIENPYARWNAESNHPENFDQLLIYDYEENSFEKVICVYENGMYVMYSENGERRAEIIDTDGAGSGKLY